LLDTGGNNIAEFIFYFFHYSMIFREEEAKSFST